MKTMFLFVAGIFLSLNVFAQPLQVDANTLALWNFEIDQSTVVLDRSPNNIHGTANFVALVDSSPLNLGKARFFLDQTSFLSFPSPQYQSALDLSSKDSWTIEFRLLIAGALSSTRNIYSYGGVNIELQDGRVSAVVNNHGISYGVKTDQQVAGSSRIAVISTPSELGIMINGKVAASQSKDPAKALKVEKTMQSPIYIGGTPRDTLQSASVGGEHACAISGSGNLLCWGNNEAGEAGLGTYGGLLTIPQPVEKLRNVSQVSTGNKFSCALENSKIFCFGSNDNLALGIQGISDSTLPILVEEAQGITAIDSGSSHSCALIADGTVKCWGKNSEGQLGLGLFTPSGLSTTVPGLSGVKKIATGANHTCAIDSMDDVVCWGSNSSGQLGNSSGNSSIPTQVQGIVGAVQLALGEEHSCALLDTAEVKCWGVNLKGQLGNGQTVSSTVPVTVNGISPDIPTGVYSGIGSHTCVTLSSGRVKCWGSNSNSQLGLPISQQMALAAVDSNLTGVTSMYLGKATSCYKKYNGLACIGSNSKGLLARGTQFPANIQTEAPSLLFRPASIPGFMDDIRISKVARFVLTRPTLSSTFNTNVSTANPQISFNVASGLGLNPASLRTILNENLVSGLSLTGNSISGSLSESLLPGKNTLEVSIQDVNDNFGKIVVTINYTPMGPPLSAASIVTSSMNSCYLDGMGDVYCWGSNRWGQLGVSNIAFSSSPIKNPRLKHIAKIAITDGALCALDVEGDLFCLGSNLGGQLARHSTALNSSVFPLEVKIDGDVEDIFAGAGAFCAKLENGGPLMCWGMDENSSLGLGGWNFSPKESPETVGVKQVALGKTHSCYIMSDDSLWCRGSNLYGQLGNLGAPTGNVSTLVQVFNVSAVKNIQVGVNYSCATATYMTEGVFCWGSNRGAQFGLGTQSHIFPEGSRYPVFTGIPVGKPFVLGDGFVCTRNSLDKLLCWGTNEKGELGRGDFVFDPTGFTHSIDFQTISAKGSTVCGISEDSKVFCWGMNSYGQSGFPTEGNIHTPTEVVPHSGNIPYYDSLSLGEVNSCVKRGNANFCWGSNELGQLGLGETSQIDERLPVLQSHLITGIIKSSIGLGNICHLTSSKEVYCSGSNAFLQSGHSDPFKNVLRFNKIQGLPLVTEVDAGFDFNCAIAEDKSVWCWGNNRFGQLGSPGVWSHTAVQVQDLSDVVDIDVPVKGQIACARKTDKSVWCWGDNSFNQIPETHTGINRKPVEVSQLNGSIAIALGGSFTCGLLETGSLKCGAINFYGTSGLGHNDDNSNWAAVDTDKTFVDVKAGENHVCALDSLNTVYCWGENDRGQIGAGHTSESINRPRRILDNVRELAVGGLHSCAITNDNKMACWGVNADGQFGTGTTVDSSSPVFIEFSKKF